MKSKICSSFLCPALTYDLAASQEIRKINPPKLGVAHLGTRILCYRPMRKRIPNMTVEQIQGKLVAHNYGHGGSGWSLGPGAAKYVNQLLENTAGKTLSKESHIVVVGAGVIGLYTAYDLVRRGYTNLTIVARDYTNLTSHKAGGSLGFASYNAPEFQEVIDQISIDSYMFYASIVHQQHPDFTEGAVMVPFYLKNREHSGFERFVNKVMMPAKDVVLDFGNGVTQEMVAYDDGIFIHTEKMLGLLYAYLTAFEVQFEQKEIVNLSEISSSFIINCTGLGAQTLADDQDLIPVQGHLITLKDQNPDDLQYIIYLPFEYATTATGYRIERFFYQAPKQTAGDHLGVIGGTYIEGASDASPHVEEFDTLIQRAKDFYGIK
jgi:hypothetical protein